jgi:hypothetical protein
MALEEGPISFYALRFLLGFVALADMTGGSEHANWLAKEQRAWLVRP